MTMQCILLILSRDINSRLWQRMTMAKPRSPYSLDHLIPFNRSFVVHKSQTVWQAKTWGIKVAWFLVLVFMLTLQMAHSNKLWWKVLKIYNYSQCPLNPPKSRISVGNWRSESAECLWSWWCWWQKRTALSPSNCGVQLNRNKGREAFIHAEAIRQIQRNLC